MLLQLATVRHAVDSKSESNNPVFRKCAQISSITLCGLTAFDGEKSTCGFPPSVYRRFQENKLISNEGCRYVPTPTKRRFFLLSINESKESNPPKERTCKKSLNRKYASRSGSFIHNGETYLVNAKKSGYYTKIMHKIIEQLEISLDKWKRVLVVRFDLHTAFYSGNNTRLTRFIDNLKGRLQRKYGIFKVGYAWAREIEKAKSQHYHFALFLDGNKVRHSKNILEMVSSTWEKTQHKNHVPVIPKPYHFINSPESKADAIYRISYLAKTRGKGYRDAQAKDYSTSRLQPKLKIIDQ